MVMGMTGMALECRQPVIIVKGGAAMVLFLLPLISFRPSDVISQKRKSASNFFIPIIVRSFVFDSSVDRLREGKLAV